MLVWILRRTWSPATGLSFRARSVLLALACVPISGVRPASGAESATGSEPADKCGYTLWNPTPRSLLRELSPDRPDKTESPYTVDAGHFQLETDLLSYTRDRDTSGGGDTRTEAWAIAPVNLKAGLFNDADLQLVLETYNRVRTEDRAAGAAELHSGFGDVTLRLKKNFWGNDGGRTALAMMPFVKLPSNQNGLGNNAAEAGIVFPLVVKLPHGWDVGLISLHRLDVALLKS